MIFFVSDYICYIVEKGNYSSEVREQDDARLASVDNFPDLDKIPPGSVLFCHTRTSFMSWLAMYYTNSIWSHVTCFIGDGMLVDATTGGVIKHHASDYLNNKNYIKIFIIKHKSEEQSRDAMARANSSVGHGFNWLGIILFWIDIIIGNNIEWRIKHSLDFLILFFLLSLIWPVFYYFNLVYFVILAFFLVKRLILGDGQEF